MVRDVFLALFESTAHVFARSRALSAIADAVMMPCCWEVVLRGIPMPMPMPMRYCSTCVQLAHAAAPCRPPRAQLKAFIKCVNYTHLMPTRYALEVELKSVVTSDIINGSQSNPTARSTARKEVKKLLSEKYDTALKTGKHKWFFQKLRF